jgi:PKD repeat protein
MKEINVTAGFARSNARQIVLMLAAFFFLLGKTFAQAPPLQWNFTSEFDNPYLGGAPGTSGEDWLFNVIGTSNGGSLGVGFAEMNVNGVTSFPAAVKVDINGVKEWIIGYTDNNSYGGAFHDVVELDGYYYMVGSKPDPLDLNHGAAVLVKTDLSGNVVYFKYFRTTNLTNFSAWESAHNNTPYPVRDMGFSSISVYLDPSSNTKRLILSGSISMVYTSQGIDVAMGALLINTDLSGNIIPGFGYGGNGYQVYNRQNNINNRTIGGYATKVTNSNTGAVTGFVLTGSTLHAPVLFSSSIHCPNTCDPNCNIKDRDVYLAKTDLNGNLTWENTYDQSTFTIAPAASVCAQCPRNTFSEAGMQVEQQPCTNNFIVLAHYNLNICYCNTCNLGGLTLLDAVVFGVNGTSGSYSSSVFQGSLADHFTGDDYVSQMSVQGDGSVVVSGNNPSSNPWPDFITELVKLPAGGGSPVWIGTYPASDPEICHYGLAQALDDGFLMAGINGRNDDDFDITKTEGQLNCSGYTTYTQGGYSHGGTPGQYFTAHFDDCFSGGLTIGCSIFNIRFTNKNAVRTFLTHHGNGPSVALTGSSTNPTTPHCEFERQLVTLALNVGFDRCDACFAPAASHLANMYVTLPPFTGMTVSQILALANDELGTCSSTFSLSALNTVVTAINESYDPGGCNGNAYCNILSCQPIPPQIPPGNCALEVGAGYSNNTCKVQFNDNSVSQNSTVISGSHWDFGDGTSSNARSPLHTYLHEGNYNVCLTDFAYNEHEKCQYTKCYDIQSGDCQAEDCKLIPDFDYVQQDCKMYFTDYSESSNSTSIMRWLWNFGDNTQSTFENPTHTYAKAGTYKVCLTVYGRSNSDECPNTVCMDVDVTQECQSTDCAMTPDFNYVIDGCRLHLEDNTTAASSTVYDRRWNISGLPEMVGDQVDCSLPGNGTYQVCLSLKAFDGHGKECSDGICQDIVVENCNPRLAAYSDITSFALTTVPNPSEGNFELKISSPYNQSLQLELVNIYGQLIQRKSVSVTAGVNSFSYKLSDVAKGIYSLRAFNGMENRVIKITIQ